MTDTNCNFNSDFAFILNNIDDKLCNKINITDYLKNKDLQKEIKDKKQYLICKNKHELIKYESIIKKSHFKHKKNNSMTDWHKEWQSNFKQTEIRIGNNIADVLVCNTILEFQHSFISVEDVENRKVNAINNNKTLNWIIDCNDTIEVNKIGNIYMIYFYNDTWKYEHFLCHDYIFLNLEDKIYKINPNEVKSNMIDVIEMKTKNEFIKSMKDNINIWSEQEIPQCILYHNQRGAGCGKTYESIQLLNTNEKFKHKNTFIYLTKMHSAKEVIYNELKEQYNRGSLDKLEIPEEGYNLSGKQYKINYKHKDNKNEYKIIIGTIDSFMYAIGNKKNKDKDYFVGIVKSIRDGYVETLKDGSIKYSQSNIKLNKKCLIIIDEAQDLDHQYIEAVCSIMRNTYIDAYIIGDKLQSILGEHNIHTFLEFNSLPHTTIEKSNGINQVMRFHNEKFKDFVNDIIDFKKYNLPPITDICNNINCKYTHENNITPYTIFQIPVIYSQDYAVEKVNTLINKIINYMEIETIKYNYLPNNFMFIFPILTKNHLAYRLVAKIQEYWKNKFDNKEYQTNVLSKSSYWANKINDGNYYEYIFMHKSDEGNSIDLRQSENATRILSVHASKGNGREVVFLFGLKQWALERFSKDKCNLQYESLLHVALTRQKKSLYIGIENVADDISERLSKYDILLDTRIKPNLDGISTFNRYNKIIDYSLSSNIIFKDINEKYLESNNFENLIPNNKDDKDIVEWGHHLIRKCVFNYNFLYNISNNDKIENNNEGKMDQFTTILYLISKLNPELYEHNDYYDKINTINTNNNKIFPILKFNEYEKGFNKYIKFQNIICCFIKNIQKNIKKGLTINKLPVLCPLETTIVLHMKDLYNNGRFSEISIMDIYSIVYYFDECSNSIDETHNFNCLCRETFYNNNNDNFDKHIEIRQSIINHYNKTIQVNTLYENYKKYIADNFSDTNHFTYNIDHPLFYSDCINFKLNNKYDIIAYSDKYVIHHILTPQFNKLNFNKIIFDVIFNKYLIMNTIKIDKLDKSNNKKTNYDRYNNKTIYACILTLDSIEPIFINMNIDKNCNIIQNSIKQYLLKEYCYKHISIYQFYQYCKENKPKGISSVKYTYDNIIREHEKRSGSRSNIPQYIENFFYDINNEVKKCYGDKNLIEDVLVKVNNKDIFLENIKIYLEKSINDFINDESTNIEIDY
jgi:hypothetical protein